MSGKKEEVLIFIFDCCGLNRCAPVMLGFTQLLVDLEICKVSKRTSKRAGSQVLDVSREADRKHR